MLHPAFQASLNQSKRSEESDCTNGRNDIDEFMPDKHREGD